MFSVEIRIRILLSYMKRLKAPVVIIVAIFSIKNCNCYTIWKLCQKCNHHCVSCCKCRRIFNSLYYWTHKTVDLHTWCLKSFSSVFSLRTNLYQELDKHFFPIINQKFCSVLICLSDYLLKYSTLKRILNFKNKCKKKPQKISIKKKFKSETKQKKFFSKVNKIVTDFGIL